MIRFLKFTGPITVPAQQSVITLYNHEVHGPTIQAEECPVGFRLRIGKTVEGKFVADGRVVRVPWHMVEYVTEHEAKEQKK